MLCLLGGMASAVPARSPPLATPGPDLVHRQEAAACTVIDLPAEQYTDTDAITIVTNPTATELLTASTFTSIKTFESRLACDCPGVQYNDW